MSINVTVVGATGVSASITNSDVVDVAFGTAFQAQVPSLLVEAGANITVTTTSGSFTVIGRDVPVASVQGRTGAVVLTRADLTAAASQHTHSATDIVGLPAGAVASVNGRTGTVVLTATDLTAAALSHTHSTAAIDGYVAPTVFSINGRTGTVALTASDVTAASATHTHNVTDITDFAAQSAKYGPVSSINGRTGTVTISATDLTCAPLIHTHAASFISDFATEAAKYGPVTSVNGRTGAVVISRSEITAAAATHTHATADIVGLTNVANVVSVNGLTGAPSIVAGSNVTITTGVGSITIASGGGGGGGGGGNVSSVAGRTGTVVLTVSDIGNLTSVANVVSVNGKTGAVSIIAADVTAASSTHAHPYVQSLNSLTGTPSIVAGANIQITTAASSITIAANAAASLSIGTVTSGTAAAASISGSPPVLNLTLPKGDTGTFGTPQDLSSVTAAYSIGLADAGKMLLANSTSSITLTVPSYASVSFPVGTHIDVARIGSGAVSFVGASGVTVNSTPGLTLRARYSSGTLISTETNTWLLVGDLSS